MAKENESVFVKEGNVPTDATTQPDTIEVVSVIQMSSGTMLPVKSFTITNNDSKKNILKNAEDLFIKRIEEHERKSLSDEDKEFFLNEGHYDDGCTEIFLTWSE